MLAISYYTDDAYRKRADKLKASLDSFGIPHDIRKVNDRGSVKENQRWKPHFIYELALENPTTPLLWIDADCVLRARPSMLESMPEHYDLAAYYWSAHQPWNGLLWMAPHESVGRMLDHWIDANAASDNDLENFYHVLAKPNGLRVLHLPPAYFWVERWMRPRFHGVAPVIEHYAASQP